MILRLETTPVEPKSLFLKRDSLNSGINALNLFSSLIFRKSYEHMIPTPLHDETRRPRLRHCSSQLSPRPGRPVTTTSSTSRASHAVRPPLPPNPVTLERLLFLSLSHKTSLFNGKPSRTSRTRLCTREAMARSPGTFSMMHAQGADRGVDSAEQRESMYRIFTGCPNLVMYLQIDAVLGVFRFLRKKDWFMFVWY